MKFIVDTNLPPGLVTWLTLGGHEANHTIDLGLERAPDRVIWQHAKVSMCSIITKDEDFVLMQAMEPNGPAVVWIRIGNATRKVLLGRLANAWPTALSRLAIGEKVVEIR